MARGWTVDDLLDSSLERIQSLEHANRLLQEEVKVLRRGGARFDVDVGEWFRLTLRLLAERPELRRLMGYSGGLLTYMSSYEPGVMEVLAHIVSEWGFVLPVGYTEMLVDRLGVSKRTIQRYMDTLRRVEVFKGMIEWPVERRVDRCKSSQRSARSL